MINLLIVDDQKDWRNALRFIVKDDKDIAVIGECSDGDEVIPFLEHHREVNTILMDVKMKRMDGINATKLVKSKFPEIQVFAHSLYDVKTFGKMMLDAGADSYIEKGDLSNKVFERIKMNYI